jgi:Zinc-finger associated domain (zf-AD)/Zinc finger, C2H2 type
MEEFVYLLQKIRNDRINLREDMEAIMHLQKDMMHKICRLCLSGMAEKLQPSARIYKNKIKFSDLAEKLLAIKINLNQPKSSQINFHSNICEECSSSLILFHHFREKCEQNNIVLNKLKKLVHYYDTDDENSTPPFPASKLLRLEIDTGMESAEMEQGDPKLPYDRDNVDLDMECIIGDPYGDKHQVLFADTSIFPHAIKKELEDDDLYDPKPKRAPRVKKYSCKFCEFRFEVPSKLRKHLSGHVRRDKLTAEKNGDVFVEAENEAYLLMQNLSSCLITNPMAQSEGSGPSVSDVVIEPKTPPKPKKRPAPAAVEPIDEPERKFTPGGREKRYTCPLCEFMAESPSKLKRHMSKHLREMKAEGDGDTTVTCAVCECEFPTQDNLNVHMLDHEALAARSRNRASVKQDSDANRSQTNSSD